MEKTRVLIVEDEAIVATDLQNRLQYLGYEVAGICSTGVSAIEKAKDTYPDIILMDILLKGNMDGIEASKKIKELYAIPIVYLTASSDEQTVQRAKISEPYGYILKPFDERDLNTSIEMALYRFKMEKQLKESEQWISTTLKSIGDAVITTDCNGKIKTMNPIAMKLTGWKQEDALDKELTDIFRIVNEDTHEAVENPVSKILREGKMVGLANHTLLISKSGNEIPIDDNGAPIKDEKGNTMGVVLIFRDITAYKLAEIEIRKLSSVVEQSPNPTFIADILGNLQYINPKFITYTGHQPEFAIGKNIQNLKLESIGKEKLKDIWELLKKGKVWQGVINSNSDSIDQRWEQILLSPIQNSGGNVTNIVGIIEDITERMKSEEALQKTLTQLADLNQNLDLRIHEEVNKNREKDQILIQQSRQAAMGEMIGNIAHQWRQPLNSLGMILQNIQGAYEFNKLSKEYLDNSVKNFMNILQHMSQTIDDFRNFFKPNKEKEEFSVKQAIKKTVSFVEDNFKDYSIELKINAEEDVLCVGYFNEYCQVLLNILNNAKDAFIENNIIKPKVSISLTPLNGRSSVEICDNAGGIPQNIIGKIFDPYFTTKEFGTGIGLYMSKMIIEKNMNGKISASNTIDGAKFTILL